MIYEQCAGFLKTPPLWTNEQFGIEQFDFPEVDLKGFRAVSISGKIRLGHQMEQICTQLLVHSPYYEILVNSLQVKRANRTIGEIDFILKEVETSRLIHLELTYKFYIIDTSISEPVHRLIGPNRRDMFFTKMEKIKQRQFPIVHSMEGAEALLEHGILHEIMEHQCCYKAQLFVPFGTSPVNIRPLNKACIQGYWLRFDEFNSKEFKSYRYYIPSKPEWVITPHNHVNWRSHYEILMDINMQILKENSPMVWMQKSEKAFEKLFVVWF